MNAPNNINYLSVINQQLENISKMTLLTMCSPNQFTRRSPLL